jgi:transposase
MERCNDGRYLNAQDKEALRIRVVEQIERGEDPATVAPVIGINIRTVYRWLKRFHRGGYEALRNHSRSGRARKFSEADLQCLAEVLGSSTPQEYGFPFALWTRDLVRELLRRERQIKVSPATTSRVLHRLGFTLQRPLQRA